MTITDQSSGESTDWAIELYNVTKTYGTKYTAVTAVDDVFLHVERGEIVVIMGPSGSGKTTLIQLIGALLTPTSGDIIVNGRHLEGLSKADLSKLRRSEIGFIFQTPNLLAGLTSSQNVELVLNLAGIKGRAAKERALHLLEQVGLKERTSHLPSQMSGGEQQRVAIARALANDPQIILADEPTANLDSKTGHHVVELLKRTAKNHGKTVIIATHDMRIRDLADRVLWLEDGKISVRWSDGYMIDPVCLMLVTKSTILRAEHNGKNYYFCSRGCLEKFKENPESYASRGTWNGDREGSVVDA